MSYSKLRGFTLVELLVVIGIISLLISMLLPSLNRARASAREIKCLSNMRQLGVSLLSYGYSNRQHIPLAREAWFVTPWNNNNATSWGTLLLNGGHLSADEILYCPDHELPDSPVAGFSAKEYASYWGMFSYGMNMSCSYDWVINNYASWRFSDIRQPADKILLVEGVSTELTPNVGAYAVYPWYSTASGTAWPRHGKLDRANVLWGDGHVTPVHSEQSGVHASIYGQGALTQRAWSPDRWTLK